MNKSKRIIILVVIVAAILALVYFNLKPSETSKIVIYNLLSHPILDDSVSGILDGLKIEGIKQENYEIVMLNANGEMDKLNTLAKEALLLKPELIIPVSTPVTNAVFSEADKNQKILFSTVTNPNDVKMNTNPPNMTGVCDAVNYAANIHLINQILLDKKEINIGFLYNPREANSVFGLEQIKSIVNQKRNMKLHILSVTNVNEIIDGANALVREVDVFYVGSDNTVVSAINALNSVAIKYKIPVIASDAGSVENGALAAVSVNYYDLGLYVGKEAAEILKGDKMPEDLSPYKFIGNSLLLNNITANNIDYKFPEALLDSSFKVIDKE